MRRMVETGKVGEVLAVQGTYSQDWLFYDTDYNWRLEPEVGGTSRAMADIGSHWCDMVELANGQAHLRRSAAELMTFHPVRKKPKKPIETYSGKLLTPEDVSKIVLITTEDVASGHPTALCRPDSGRTDHQSGRGRAQESLVNGSLRDEMRHGLGPAKSRTSCGLGIFDGNNQILLKDPSLLDVEARTFADLPGGSRGGLRRHGSSNSFRNGFMRPAAIKSLADQLPTFDAGLRQLRLVEAVLESSATGGWVS